MDRRAARSPRVTSEKPRPRPGPRSGSRSPAHARSREAAIDEAYGTLRRTIGAFHALHRRAAEGEITGAQTLLLRFIAVKGQTSPKGIADALGLTQGTVTSALDKLEEQGLVERTRSEEDRRVVHVTLTPSADEMMGRVEARARTHLGTLFEGWSVEEIRTLEALLEKLSARAWEQCSVGSQD